MQNHVAPCSYTTCAAPPCQKTPSESKTRFAPSHACGSGTTLTHPSAGASSSAWKISHSRATLQNWPHTEVRTFRATPKSMPFCGVQFAPLHWISERESGGSVGKYMRENASRSPPVLTVVWCWETTLVMLVQPLKSHQRKKTPHSRNSAILVWR